MPFLLTHHRLNVHTFYTVTFTLEHQSRSLSLMCITRAPPAISTIPHPICNLNRTQKNKIINCLELTETEGVIVKTFRPENPSSDHLCKGWWYDVKLYAAYYCKS